MEDYYKMFFLVTNIIIGKYYPSIITQFIFGIVCYSASFFILRDIITDNLYEEYKYCLGSLIMVDSLFILYQYKYNSVKKNIEENDKQDPSPKNVVMNTTEPVPKSSMSEKFDISFSSDINDYKITHDLSPDDDTDLSELAISESAISESAQSINNNSTDKHSVSFSLTSKNQS